ncbi:MAG: hypothetical protein CBD18_08940 [Opitutales bacterium TMED158]|nr:MAG: hypothetical protein CBD18_08940 [Opitutales bacterium TMED158]
MSDSRPNSCSQCSKPSSVYLTQILEGQVKKLSLCQNCPHAAKAQAVETVGIVDPSKAGAKPFTQGIRSIEGGLSCPNCGFKLETFKEFGRLGCPTCYDVFASQLKSVFQKVHKGMEHRGKRPTGCEASVSQEEIEALKRELQERVDKEEYEEAAALRDRIWKLEGRPAGD